MKKEEVRQYQKEWRQENKERFKELRKSWKEKNPIKWKQISTKYKKKVKIRERKLDNLRQNTRRKYGRLKKGFQYHHPRPYSVDNFIIVESGIHQFLHSHQREREMMVFKASKPLRKLGGKSYGNKS